MSGWVRASPKLLPCVQSCSQGSVLGPEEFIEGLGIGLRSFVGGTVGMYTQVMRNDTR